MILSEIWLPLLPHIFGPNVMLVLTEVEGKGGKRKEWDCSPRLVQGDGSQALASAVSAVPPRWIHRGTKSKLQHNYYYSESYFSLFFVVPYHLHMVGTLMIFVQNYGFSTLSITCNIYNK